MVSSNMAGQSPNEMEVLMGDINGYKLGMFHRPGGLSKLFFEGRNLATYLLYIYIMCTYTFGYISGINPICPCRHLSSRYPI